MKACGNTLRAALEPEPNNERQWRPRRRTDQRKRYNSRSSERNRSTVQSLLLLLLLLFPPVSERVYRNSIPIRKVLRTFHNCAAISNFVHPFLRLYSIFNGTHFYLHTARTARMIKKKLFPSYPPLLTCIAQRRRNEMRCLQDTNTSKQFKKGTKTYTHSHTHTHTREREREAIGNSLVRRKRSINPTVAVTPGHYCQPLLQLASVA